MNANIGEAPRRGSGWQWPVIIVGLLCSHIGLMSWAVALATRDRNGVVVPDYYAKSLRWDEEKAALAKSDALGWKVALAVGADRDVLDQRNVTLTLTDSDGKPVGAGAGVVSVELTYLHQARPLEVQTLKLKAENSGVFTTQLRVPHSGFHTFTVRANVGENKFMRQWSQYVGN